MNAVHFDILNTLQVNTPNKTATTNASKIKEIKNLYAEQCGFNLKDYTIVFCYDAYDLYETLIFAIVESYTNIVGKPHIVCSNMEHTDIITILNKLVKSQHITCTYIHVDIYGAVPVKNIQDALVHNTALVIVSYSNYLTGAINDIQSISAVTQEKKVPLFCDCIYTYGKYTNLHASDVFSISFGNVSMLTIKNTLVDGYKLKHHCDELQNTSVKITNNQYKQIMQILVSKRFTSVNNAKAYLLIKLANKHKLFYYDCIVKQNIVPSEKDIVVLCSADASKCVANIISLVILSNTAIVLKNKLQKNNMFIYNTPKPFEHIGLLAKWCKYVITLNLDNCDKKDIDVFATFIN